ncbi:MAG: DUF3011 domain-containing protein [Burkholderiaceae bacterium]|jgi:hypothetical protein|nr:DUF3011 domain-containing protein [Burkholderiaceae bacterium]
MKRLFSALLLTAAATGALLAAPYALAQGPRARSVLCESQDGRYHECRMPASAKRVELVRQVSDASCVEGRTWGQRGGKVWVDKGCRGEFAEAGRPGNYSVVCESNDQRTVTCSWDSRRGTPRLAEQLSSTTCRKGESWGTDRRGNLWVSRGCRARFVPR